MVEFIEDTHQYVVDGVIVPSVSELVAYALGEDTSAIPQSVLHRAGEFGTYVHKIIEKFEMEGYETDDEILRGWDNLCDKYNIVVRTMENIVYTKDYAGRYDLIATIDDTPTLIDIKTNRVYPKEHLEYQMGLYLNALKDNMPCYCAWYEKAKGKWHFRKVEPISKEECENIVSLYKQGLEYRSLKNNVTDINIYTPQQIEKIKTFYELKKQIDEIEKSAKLKALEMMKDSGDDVLENDLFRIKYVAPYERDDIDRELLKQDGLYDKYLKKVHIKESVKITPKWEV